MVVYSAEKRNVAPPAMSTGRRPNLSPSQPATMAPRMQPTRAALPNQPRANLLRPNCFSTKPKVPEMTAVSNPNRNPPSDATRQTEARKNPEPRAGASASDQLSAALSAAMTAFSGEDIGRFSFVL